MQMREIILKKAKQHETETSCGLWNQLFPECVTSLPTGKSSLTSVNLELHVILWHTSLTYSESDLVLCIKLYCYNNNLFCVALNGTFNRTFRY